MAAFQLSTMNIAGLVIFGIAALIAFYHLYFILEDATRKGSTNYITWMHDTLDKMFIKTSKRKCFYIVLTSALICGMIGFYYTFDYGLVNIIITISFLFIGWNIPKFYINFKYKKRIEKFDDQLIDALILMSNSIKSNLNLNQAIGVVVNELQNPCSQEFGLVLSQHKLGLTIDEALEKMMARIPSEDLTMVLNSILILREKGGNISETFDVISTTIRERRKVEGKIKTITAQGKMQSFLLFMMPFAVGLIMYMLNPEDMSLMFSTQTGWVLIMIMLAMQTIGGLWLKKIVDIKV